MLHYIIKFPYPSFKDTIKPKNSTNYKKPIQNWCPFEWENNEQSLQTNFPKILIQIQKALYKNWFSNSIKTENWKCTKWELYFNSTKSCFNFIFPSRSKIVVLVVYYHQIIKWIKKFSDQKSYFLEFCGQNVDRHGRDFFVVRNFGLVCWERIKLMIELVRCIVIYWN